MKASLYSLIAALMIWLPVSQAAVLCCPAGEHADAVMAMPESGAAHCAHAGDAGMPSDTAADCLSACVQLGQMPVPVAIGVAPGPLHKLAPLPVAPVDTLAAHRMPLLRPPSRS